MRACRRFLILAASLAGCAYVPDAPERTPGEPTWEAIAPETLQFREVARTTTPGYTHIEYSVDQPKYRWRPCPVGAVVHQYVSILMPTGVSLSAPVLYHQGNEQKLDAANIIDVFTHIGRNDLIYVQAEHRGYGHSLTDDVDQSVPDYVTSFEAVQDSHAIIHALKPLFSGPWIGAGWSYGGSVVLEHAAQYPGDYKTVFLSSTPINWPTYFAGYDQFIANALGPTAYAQLNTVVHSLAPAHLFDQNWKDREFLTFTAVGLAQTSSYAPMIPVLQNYLATKTTPDLLATLYSLDAAVSFGLLKGWSWSSGERPFPLTDAGSASNLGHTWKYQQCTELGVFFGANQPTALLGVRDAASWRAECEALFYSYNLPAELELRDMKPALNRITQLGVRAVLTGGGLDPWYSISEPHPTTAPITTTPIWSEYAAPYGRFFFAPNARHLPDWETDTTLLAHAVNDLVSYATN